MELCNIYHERCEAVKPIDITDCVRGFEIQRERPPMFIMGTTEARTFAPARKQNKLTIQFNMHHPHTLSKLTTILMESTKDRPKTIVFNAGLGVTPFRMEVNEYGCDNLTEDTLIFYKMKLTQTRI